MRTTAFLLFASSLTVASAKDVFVPGSSRGCIAGKKCADAIKMSAAEEIELFIKDEAVFEVYPGRAVSVNRFEIEGGGLYFKDNITALRAINSSFASSYIRAQKIRIDVGDFENPEIEFQVNGRSYVEMYWNRFITINEHQARGNIKVGLNSTNFTGNTDKSTIYAPFSPLLIKGQHSTLALEAATGIKLVGTATGLSSDAGDCTPAGMLGLVNSFIHVCVGTSWVKIQRVSSETVTPGPATPPPARLVAVV